MTDSLQEANKRNSAADQSRIQQLHDTAVALGARCSHDTVKRDLLPAISESVDRLYWFRIDSSNTFTVPSELDKLEEAARRNSAPDAQRIQEVHDTAVALGATCARDNVPGVLEKLTGEAWKDASDKGKRCVAKLMARGLDESAAIAICRSSLGEALPVKYQGINFTPPEDVQKAAMSGLALRKRYGRGGLTTRQAGEQGIGSGVARATTLAQGSAVSPETIRQMVAFFSRHAQHKDTPPEKGNGRIAWLLWGGDAGQDWATRILRQMDAADKKAETITKVMNDE